MRIINKNSIFKKLNINDISELNNINKKDITEDDTNKNPFDILNLDELIYLRENNYFSENENNIVYITLLKIEDGIVEIEATIKNNQETFLLDIDPINKKIINSTRNFDIYVDKVSKKIFDSYTQYSKIIPHMIIGWN